MAIYTNMLKRDAEILVHGARHEDSTIADLQVRALDDEAAFAVYCDWYLTHIRPDWSDNVHFRPEWVRGSIYDMSAAYDVRNELILKFACADILAQRSGERPSISDRKPSYDGYIVVEHWAGRVCAVWSTEERIMSDVWDNVYHAGILTADGRVLDLSCGCAGNGTNIEVDASPETLAQYQQTVAENAARVAAKRAESERQAREAREAAEKLEARKGRMVQVVRGRKIPKGTTGVCFWRGQTQYGERVGFKTDKGETLWTDARNVQAISA